MIDAWRLYPVIALAALAAGSLWLERVTRPDEPLQQVEQTTPDFIVSGSRVVGFGAQGDQRYELLSERMEHYPASDITRLHQPRLRIQRDTTTTLISARSADVAPGGERIDFAGDVRVRRPGAGGAPALGLDAQTLAVWPDAHRASSNTAVVLTRGDSRATAQGMRADNLFGTLELIGNVRAQLPRRQGSKP